MNYDNNAFCVLPFIHKHKRLSGATTVCCQSQKPITPNDVTEIRQKMCSGEKTEHCKTCYTHEEKGVVSSRMRENERWLADSEVKEYLDNFTFDGKEKTFSYDLRYSNICNLACIGCMPQQSSLWAKELDVETPPFDFPFELEDMKDAKWIYLAGGEPFLTPELVKLLQFISEQDTQPFICINTNLTVQDDDVKEICKKLKSLTLHISFDGVGGVAEYHRWPIKWEKFSRNLEWAKSLECNIMFNTVIDAVNVSFIHEMLEYQDLPSLWNLNMMLTPAPLCVENLPSHLKQNAYDNFIKLRDARQYRSDANFKRNVEAIASKILEQGNPISLSTHLQAMDKRRNINHVDFLGIDLK